MCERRDTYLSTWYKCTRSDQMADKFGDRVALQPDQSSRGISVRALTDVTDKSRDGLRPAAPVDSSH